MIEQDAERYANKRRDQMGATLCEKTSRPNGSNVIEVTSRPKGSNVIEVTSRPKGSNVAQKNVATEWEQRYFREQRKLACCAKPK